jgi:DNA-binding protein H-NS
MPYYVSDSHSSSDPLSKIMIGTVMRDNFKSMSTDQLWALHEKIAAHLSARLTAERNELELRLKQLTRGVEAQHAKSSTERRPYPKVVPKFRNPDRPSETWSGRGRKPLWLTAQLKRGKRIDDFLIEREAA